MILITKIKEEDSPSLTEEEAEYFENNQELVEQKIQEVLNQDIETEEDVAKAFEEQKPTEDIKAKKVDIENIKVGEIVLFQNEKFDFNEFMHKVRLQPTALVDCANRDQYRTLIEDIYNYKSRNKINLRY